MKLIKTASTIFLLLSSFAVSAETTTQSLPTKPSQPIPSIQETQNPDTVLREKVQAKLVKIPSLKGQAVSASSYDQVITLEGSVENKEQEQAAIDAAKSTPGVKEVKSNLTIKLFDKTE